VKFKRCCGSTRVDEQALARRLEAEMDVEALPALVPGLRPHDAGFDAWAAGIEEPPEELWNATLEAGVAAIGAVERARILATAADGAPWRDVVEELGDEERAEALLLRGAVAAGLRERRPPGPELFALLDRVPQALGNPIALVAVLLNPFDVWGVDQLAELDQIGDRQLAENGVDALWDGELRARLLRKVDWLARHVPLGRGGGLDAAVLEACELIRDQDEAQRELAALVLARAGAFIAAGAY
jgi:hypothetical protein